MMNINVDGSVVEKNIHLGIIEVEYPKRSEWNESELRNTAIQELTELRKHYIDYDRKETFGRNPYVRFYKKFKKTYPVLLQFESFVINGAPFPDSNPVTQVSFLFELKTLVLAGVHDVDRIEGDLEVFISPDKLNFTGIRGDEIHTYKGDFCGRDDKDIIFSEIAGVDNRTCITENSNHVAYFVFGTPDMSEENIMGSMNQLIEYVKILAPTARIETQII